MASPTRRSVRCTLSALPLVWLALSAFAQPSPSVTRQPVLVELFTSEGCSDCPPADALLARLDSTQFVPGAQAIVLSEHVTYWNHLGWRDPFSFDAMSQRQSQYALHFSLDSVYTPQMVVDGAHQFVGSDTAALSRAVANAASHPKPQISIQNAHLANGALSFSVRGPAGAGAMLVVALAEDATHSEVAHGENAGRTLHHVAVARVLKEYDSKFADGRTIQLAAPAPPPNTNAAGPLRLVVFLADRQTGYVAGAAELTVSR
jgi:hypothetical protein